MDNKIAIIDLDSILFAGAWGNKILDPNTGEYMRNDKGTLIYQDKTEEEIRQGIDDILIDILDNTNATGHIMYVKGKNTSAHRYNIKSNYKSNRPKESPKWWEFAKNYVLDSWEAYAVDNIEVDDAVNITRLNIENSFIVAIDKDLLNLEGIHYNWKTKEWITIDAPCADYNFWFDMIVGQPGDGVAGLPRYGKTAAGKLLDPESTENYNIQVFKEYLKVYGENIGIIEFYKNYTCLKILESYEDFKIPPFIEWKTIEENSEGDISWLDLS